MDFVVFFIVMVPLAAYALVQHFVLRNGRSRHHMDGLAAGHGRPMVRGRRR
jgi:hypothetical protein